ncbi:MAG: hypothetical protein K8S54_01540 [Spirochaetia bacterium]|nr:hypothetical protein [Spirochaetia bacterium]
MDDLILLKRALSVEIDKRSAILSADGRELQRKTRESEEILRQMRASIEDPSRKDRSELSPEARKIAERLQIETTENDRLLENANHTIHRLLTEMAEKDTVYSPVGGRSGSTGGVLLDASV